MSMSACGDVRNSSVFCVDYTVGHMSPAVKRYFDVVNQNNRFSHTFFSVREDDWAVACIT